MYRSKLTSDRQCTVGVRSCVPAEAVPNMDVRSSRNPRRLLSSAACAASARDKVAPAAAPPGREGRIEVPPAHGRAPAASGIADALSMPRTPTVEVIATIDTKVSRGPRRGFSTTAQGHAPLSPEAMDAIENGRDLRSLRVPPFIRLLPTYLCSIDQLHVMLSGGELHPSRDRRGAMSLRLGMERQLGSIGIVLGASFYREFSGPRAADIRLSDEFMVLANAHAKSVSAAMYWLAQQATFSQRGDQSLAMECFPSLDLRTPIDLFAHLQAILVPRCQENQFRAHFDDMSHVLDFVRWVDFDAGAPLYATRAERSEQSVAITCATAPPASCLELGDPSLLSDEAYHAFQTAYFQECAVACTPVIPEMVEKQSGGRPGMFSYNLRAKDIVVLLSGTGSSLTFEQQLERERTMSPQIDALCSAGFGVVSVMRGNGAATADVLTSVMNRLKPGQRMSAMGFSGTCVQLASWATMNAEVKKLNKLIFAPFHGSQFEHAVASCRLALPGDKRFLIVPWGQNISTPQHNSSHILKDIPSATVRASDNCCLVMHRKHIGDQRGAGAAKPIYSYNSDFFRPEGGITDALINFISGVAITTQNTWSGHDAINFSGGLRTLDGLVSDNTYRD